MNPPIKQDRQSMRRAIKILWILQGHSFEGLRLTQITKALNVSISTVFRDLETLADEGVTERIPGNEEAWRLTPRIVQLARAHDEEFQRLQHRVSEFNQRFTRTQ